ncbi:MAG: large subunit ribosomal protein L2 [Candidatus Peregrinibacteria bacterium Gr01-1014_25]|nr:MAG: large subunit ribosomal protein L2 [Candidatus Peregrinibacteria bacterium Gr01-1014_25]
MPKQMKPTTPGRRQMTIADFSDITRTQPEKGLTRGKRGIHGRSSDGRIAIRHRGGGHKRLWRSVDLRQTDKQGVAATVASIEYDPNRTARIALVQYADGEKRYILAPQGLNVGDQIVCAERTKVKVGNRMQLKHIPVGYHVFNIETQPGKGGAIVRSAGTSATLVGFDGDHAIIQLPSTEMRRIRNVCCATIGVVSNPEHNLITIGKAGRVRWMGKRPTVLGKSMNPVDHPHGGGEGHCSIGLKAPKTPWGKKALGVKTRRLHRYSDQSIIRRRVHKKKRD